MTKANRYDVSGLTEAQYQRGSHGRVLRNLLGITGKRLMDETEAREQKRALKEILSFYTREHRFKAEDICRMHKIWLGGIYVQAGMNYDYGPMEKIFSSVIEKTLRGSAGP